MYDKLYSDIKYIKGIGPKRASYFLNLGIKTVQDLLTFFPRDYQDRKNITKIKDIVFSRQYCVCGTVTRVYDKKFSKSLAVFCVEIDDETGTLTVRFFRKYNPYSKFDILASLRKNFSAGRFAYFYGLAEAKFGYKQLSADDYEVTDSKNDIPKSFFKLVPVYNLTYGITQKTIFDVMVKIMEFAQYYPDILKNAGLNNKFGLIPLSSAIQNIHFPDTFEDIEKARRSFALQEFLILQILLLTAKNNKVRHKKRHQYIIKKTLLSQFKRQLSFEFTKAQKKVINEIFNDMLSGSPMNRMLMGDVGSGKTVVALSAMLLAIENGYQTAIIAPTEILAEQHYLTFKNMLKGLNIKLSLLTSSAMKNKKERTKLLTDIAEGKADIVIGTHAVMEERVQFKNISLIIIDEQHRFGVMQKVSALAKGYVPDVLMMTATPIPRGLAMTIYGEMGISVIDELPAGRIPVKTTCENENEAYGAILNTVKAGGQVYIVYPLVDESDKISLKSAVKEAEILSQTVFKNNKVGLLHGKMKMLEKNDIMTKFKNKEFDILIATTVIEVGIDVPNAAMIVIQHADRFGLATLHQLRGRVGRNSRQSYCILVSGSNSAAAKQRLSVMTRTTDGFKIASEDLKLRGPGEFIGTKQHGFPEFKAGNIITDIALIDYAKDLAKNIIEKDPALSSYENRLLNDIITKTYGNKLKLTRVG